MVEVERKYRIADKNMIMSKLIMQGYKQDKTIHQVDRVYLVHSDSFATFKRGDPVARIRTVDGAHTLTLKRAINMAGDSIEHEMTVNPVKAAVGLLSEMGYKPVTDVDKVRIEYRLAGVTVAVDEVVDLGSFVEVEVLCDNGHEKTAQEQVASAAAKLGLDDEAIVVKKYDQLISELSEN